MGVMPIRDAVRKPEIHRQTAMGTPISASKTKDPNRKIIILLAAMLYLLFAGEFIAAVFFTYV